MCWIQLCFGSFTIYVYEYLRGFLAAMPAWTDSVIGFLTQWWDPLGDPGLVTSPLGAVVSMVLITLIFIVVVRIRIIYIKSLTCTRT
jgi:hypothetical protein